MESVFETVSVKTGRVSVKKSGKKVLLLISLSIMLWQVSTCMNKIVTTPTGTKQRLSQMENISLSMSFCRGMHNSVVIKPYSISVELNDNNWTTLGDYSKKFVSKDDNYPISCESIEIIGKKIKITHMYHKNRQNQISIYIHETGFFNSQFKMKLTKNNLLFEMHTVLNIQRLQQLPNDKCVEDTKYDICFNNYLKTKLNSSIGCILNNMK